MKIQDIRIKERIQTKAKFLPMGEKILKYTPYCKYAEEVFTYKDLILSAFRWDATPEGHDYWQGVVDSIEPPNMPNCPQCNSRKIYFKRKLQLYCCQKCQINYDETKTNIRPYRAYGSYRQGNTN